MLKIWGCPRHTFERQQSEKHKQVSRGHHWCIIHTKFKTENSLPRCFPSKRLRFEQRTEIPDSICLLRVEMLYGGEIFKNQDYGSTHARGS